MDNCVAALLLQWDQVLVAHGRNVLSSFVLLLMTPLQIKIVSSSLFLSDLFWSTNLQELPILCQLNEETLCGGSICRRGKPRAEENWAPWASVQIAREWLTGSVIIREWIKKCRVLITGSQSLSSQVHLGKQLGNSSLLTHLLKHFTLFCLSTHLLWAGGH